ncbi:transcriptional regulator [Actinopolyspora erythraea]|uniref:Transcriptional regulator n=2 Tax=Actinopolyspora TaxID=1849 RepID=A0A2T0H1X8_ACTMO|nr:transcriptional regulator [Actinopolyspora mortivallis]ASU79113.1 transcriptional regulator [Actinopolyspora erythraea]PRW65337.1 transcriptional regulator [Actinopolyspora mortivallis]
MSEDWAAVAAAIDERVKALGWRQRELADRSLVSQAIVREIQHHTVERRRSQRTLESLSVTLGWHPKHLEAVLHGRRPPEPDKAEGDDDALRARLDGIEQRLSELTERVDGLRADLNTVVEHVRTTR